MNKFFQFDKQEKEVQPSKKSTSRIAKRIDDKELKKELARQEKEQLAKDELFNKFFK